MIFCSQEPLSLIRFFKTSIIIDRLPSRLRREQLSFKITSAPVRLASMFFYLRNILRTVISY